jgi:mRNA interferase RelE/StbE
MATSKTYRVLIDHSAEKDLESLPKPVLKKVVRVIDGLQTEPRPNGVKKLAGSNENLYRVRTGDYRIIYAVEEEIKIVNIRRVRHRKDLYRGL